MPHGFPAFSQNQFPNDLSPTLFHPASPKVRPAKPEKDVKDMDASSINSAATFSSTVSLIKNSIKSKLPVSYKDYCARKDAVSQSSIEGNKTSSKKSLEKDPKSPKARTAEAYMYVAQMK